LGTTKLTSISKWILPNLVVAGLVLALAALPHYNVSLSRCALAMPPVAESMWPSIVFFMVPICITSFVMIVMLVALARHVYCRKKTERDNNTDIDNGTDDINANVDEGASERRRRQLFWQCFHYTTICLAIWLPQFAQFGGVITREMFPLLVLSALMLPSQGTLNCIVYFRTRHLTSSAARAEPTVFDAKVARATEAEDDTTPRSSTCDAAVVAVANATENQRFA
jgi:hypothetical protein